MSTSLSPNVAVVGGGVAGSAAAILLAQSGATVRQFESRMITQVGSGIMLQANALRVLRAAGVLDAINTAGYAFDSTGVRLADATCRLVAELTEGRFEEDLPAAVGIGRWALTRILQERGADLGVTLRLGTKITDLHSAESGKVYITTESGHDADTGPFDLVIGADGVNSTVRRLIGVQVEPRLLPLGVWRVSTTRPESVVRTEIINGGSAYFAGFAPTSVTSMYAWLVDDYADRRHLTPVEQLEVFRGLAAAYHGPWDAIRDSLTPDTPIGYTRYSELLMPAPWHRGRVVLMGDAVYACPPTMAQGAAQGLEDAAVLAELMADQPADEDLLTAYVRRRLPRARLVVEGSVQMAEWQLRHERGDVSSVLARTSRILAQPA